MTRLEFERFLSEHEIPISLLTLEDVHHDLQKLGA
jgi:hypothetical protein